MSDTNELLKKFVSSKSRFFSISDGEEIIVRFLSAEEVPDSFSGGKKKAICYHLEVDGKELLWDRTSRSLAQQMSQIPKGSWIKLKRIGERTKTKYFIEKREK